MVEHKQVTRTGRNVLTYGTTVTIDASKGRLHDLTVTDGVAFTMAAPTNPLVGQVIIVLIENTSGGAMGAITWANAFLLAGAFTNPASAKTRTIAFIYDGTSWTEFARTDADM